MNSRAVNLLHFVKSSQALLRKTFISVKIKSTVCEILKWERKKTASHIVSYLIPQYLHRRTTDLAEQLVRKMVPADLK